MNRVGRMPRPVRRVAVMLGVAVLAAAVVVGQLVDSRAASPTSIALNAAIAVSFGAMAVLVLQGMAGHRVGRFMAAAAVLSYLAVFAASWSGWLPLAWVTQWLVAPPLGLIVASLLVFPDGRLPSPRWWWRGLATVVGTSTVVVTLSLAVAALDHPRTLVTTAGDPYTARALVFVEVARVAILVLLASLFGVVAALWARWRRADGLTRLQLACLLPAGAVLLAALVLEGLGVTGAWAVAAVVVPVAMTVAVLRYHLYGLDRIINRGVVWLVMSLLVIAAFVAIVVTLRDLLAGGTSLASLVATVAVAVTFEPLRRRVQRGVDRLFYGDRDDPYRVIARLGERIGQTLDPDAVLPLQAADIARSMQVPYVAVELAERTGPRLFTEHGTMTTTLEAFDMLAHGERVGRLLVATRGVDAPFSRRERRLLADAAVHVAVAVEATRLIRDLRESRARLIAAQEEERRRLWRDLHDGVGPALTGLLMQVRAARKAADQRSRVAEILDGLASDLRVCKTELRGLVDQLRPQVLDGGLEAALRAECRRFDDDVLSVDLSVAGPLDGLPTAVEVAACRIVSEALHNVKKHANARTCRVSVDRGRSLTVEIIDDGVGIGEGRGRHRGVGLTSMRERAADLGGDCVVATAVPRGTAVRVKLPLDVAPRD